MRCTACDTDNPVDRKFCGGCGALLAHACPACGTPNEPRFAFCGECGGPLDETAGRGAGPAPTGSGLTAPQPKAERRLVSVLFADIVGFTTLSEARDPEDVRELLTRYFDACRSCITRYGGVVEKFIGDAVMAVWGAPHANEDDAERAVRAALELVEAVRELGVEIRAEGLAARAGVLTGEAAVNLQAQGEGMVAGDLVNSASRVQGIASPGTVLVDDATRRATEAAVAYQDAGAHELKGKQETIALWRPLRVVAGRGGALRSAGLEAPFVGRSREFNLIKDLFHGCVENGTAHLTSVTGIAGIGKSRLSWELFKYIDGLTDTAWWHRGRCLAYGEGVTYWALAEMIRARAGIQEDEPTAAAAAKLAAIVDDVTDDPDERKWIQPRLAALLGLEDQGATDAADLFSGWRLFFERLAQRYPVILVFEDVHWADEALLDFIEYLLEWSRNHRLYVLTLGRPEVTERRPGWGAGRRNGTSLSLDPLPDQAMDDLLDGLVPGLPDSVRDRIRDRAEGVPLYAVETVRMLVDRGTLVREADRYVPVAPVDELDVPETLQALIAARLDGLSQLERCLLQNASVLGKTFTAAALASVSGQDEAAIAPVLNGLVRKELLGVQADPRSPERGQYAFLQSLIQKVSHDTLARRDRKALHLAAAAYLQQNWADEGEVVQVIASHYLDAYTADPDAADAADIRASARDFLARAGDRAAALAAQDEADRYYLRAAGLSDDAVERATLLMRSGRAAHAAGHSDEAEKRFEESLEIFRGAGDDAGSAGVLMELAFIRWWDRSDLSGAVELLREARALAATAPHQVRAAANEMLARCLFFLGDHEESLATVDEALDIAEAHRLLHVLSNALNTKALVLTVHARGEEAASLLQGALRVAQEAGVGAPILRAYVNLSYVCAERDRLEEGAGYARSGLALARQVGDRSMEWFFLQHLAGHYYWGGRWDDYDHVAAQVPDVRDEPDSRSATLSVHVVGLLINTARGVRPDPPPHVVAMFEPYLDSADTQERVIVRAYLAELALIRDDPHQALELATRALEAVPTQGRRHPMLQIAFQTAVNAAIRIGDLDTADQLIAQVEEMPAGQLCDFLLGESTRQRARVLLATGQPGVEQKYREAESLLAGSDLRYQLAVVRGELAEWLCEHGRAAEARPLIDAALDVVTELRVEPWLQRLALLRPPETAASA
jgi:class 3 adenylate cyclase/tetratricopeptide (TPR) repeat protein